MMDQNRFFFLIFKLRLQIN